MAVDLRAFGVRRIVSIQLRPSQADRIIYVIRDPRDIVVSGAHFFSMERWPAVGALFRPLPMGERMYRRLLNPLITPRRRRVQRIMDTVLHGSQ